MKRAFVSTVRTYSTPFGIIHRTILSSIKITFIYDVQYVIIFNEPSIKTSKVVLSGKQVPTYLTTLLQFSPHTEEDPAEIKPVSNLDWQTVSCWGLLLMVFDNRLIKFVINHETTTMHSLLHSTPLGARTSSWCESSSPQQPSPTINLCDLNR